MKKTFVLSVLIISLIACFGQLSVYKIMSNGNLENVNHASKQGRKPLIFTNPSKLSSSFFYTLPLTVIKIDVDVIEKRFIKGPYSEYADKLLGLKNIVKDDYYEYELADVNMSTEPRPDADNYYYVEILKNSKNNNLVVSLTEDNFLMQISDRQVPSAQSIKEDIIAKNTTFAEYFKYYASSSQYEKVDTIYRTITIENEVITKKFLTSTLTERPNEAKAKEIAESIGKIRESRLNLISGYQETSYEKNTLEYMISQLDALENEYMSLFKGVSLSKKIRYTYYYTPNSDVVQDYVPLFKFSQNTGIADLNSTNGREVSIVLLKDNNTSKLGQFAKKVENNSKDTDKGIYYRIPEYAEAKISYMGKDIINRTIMVNQFGVITTTLPNSTNVKFYPKTGSLNQLIN